MRARVRSSLRSVALIVPTVVMLATVVPAATAPAAPRHPPPGRAFPGKAATAAVAPVTMTDVSPDAACCPASTSSPSEGGQMDAIAVDPTNPSVVYVAGEAGGVWKSTNAGSSWFRASNGLATGETNVGYAGPDWTSVPTGSLAVDPSNPARLLYGAAPDDMSPDVGSNHARKGGLYVSLNAAGGWTHVDIPGCVNPSVQGAAFLSGRAFVGTNCGLATSSDQQLATWTITHPDGGPGAENINALATVSTTLFVCDSELRVFRSATLGATWNAPMTLSGRCDGLAAAPDTTTKFLAMQFHSKGDWRVVLGDTSSRTMAELSPPVPPNLCSLPAPTHPCNPSGLPYVVTARRPQTAANQGPGRSYSVFAANGAWFYEYTFTPEPVHPIWRKFPATHIDSHGLAIPSNYDPQANRCRVFLIDDGGVYRSEPTSTGCTVASSPFVKAVHGLHGFGSFGLAVIPQSTCPQGASPPCPAIYLPSNDNGTFGTVTGGNGAGAWHDMNCCGDSGVILADWRLPGRVVLPRNAVDTVYASTDGKPPIWNANVTSTTDMGTPNITSGTSADWLILQVQSLPGAGQSVPAAGDYVAIRSAARFGADDPQLDTVNDVIVRNRTGTAGGWKQIGPALKPFQAGRIQVSGGHTAPTIYILQANDRSELGSSQGKVLKGVASKLGVISAWTNASTGLSQAYDILADPFDSRVVYATDLGDGTIKVTNNGGGLWVKDADLTRLVTAGGRYRMGCAGGSGTTISDTGYRYQCSLAAVAFDPNHPTYRFAVLDPAGVAFSRDSGQHWMPLGVTDPMDRPDAGLFDPNANPATGQGSLYVARHGRGLMRVDARWSTLRSILFQVHDLAPGYTVSAVDETTGTTVRLLRDPDGVYRGSELFDSSTTPATHTFHYFIAETRRVTPQLSRTLTAAETAAGVATVDSFLVAESAGDQSSGGVSADFNHDGFDDLAVGVPGEDFGSIPDAGAVAVIYGSANGLIPNANQLWVQSQNGLGGTAEAGDNVGSTLAAGDLNGDGFADLAIGIPREDVGTTVDAGAVQVLFGSASGLVASGSVFVQQGTAGIADSAEAGDRFGAALAIGDFGNGAHADLAIGVPGEDFGSIVDAGAVAVVYGSPTGPTSTGNQLIVQGQGGMQGTTEAGDAFGSALAAGDFGGTGQKDLAIGVPSEDIGSTPDAGAVNVVYGSASGLTVTGNQVLVQGQNGMLDAAEAGDGFGSALAAADLGGTGQADLAVGVPAEDIGTTVDAGAVGVISGSASGLVTTGNQLFDQGQLGETVERDDAFGAAVAAADFGGTAQADLAVGTPGEDLGTVANAGLVTVAFGSASGVSASGTQQIQQGAPGWPGTPEAEDAFGSALAVGNFGESSQADLAVGAPAEDVNSTVDAGVVNVYYGSSTGPVAAGADGWVQGQAGLLDSAEAGDGFGEAVAA